MKYSGNTLRDIPWKYTLGEILEIKERSSTISLSKAKSISIVFRVAYFKRSSV
jgi:hypothetical protein